MSPLTLQADLDTPSGTSKSSGSIGLLWVDGGWSLGLTNGSSRTGPPLTRPTTHLPGFSSDFLADSHQPQVRPGVVPPFAGSEHPRFLSVGLLEDRVNENNPRTIPELKEALAEAVRAIPREECQRVIEKVCLQHQGAYLEHVL